MEYGIRQLRSDMKVFTGDRQCEQDPAGHLCHCVSPNLQKYFLLVWASTMKKTDGASGGTRWISERNGKAGKLCLSGTKAEGGLFVLGKYRSPSPVGRYSLVGEKRKQAPKE